MSDPAHSVSGRPSPPPEGILFLLFFASGAAGLVYEVLWLKELTRLFGATAQAVAVTLAVFFLGLAAGGWTWGRRAERIRDPLRGYALLEVGIAASATLYFLLLDLYRWIYGPLYAMVGDQRSVFLTVKVVLATGILFPPAFLMGGTLPLMAQYMVRRRAELGRKASLLYAVNTLGGATGALVAGFYLPQVLGFRQSYLLAIALSLLIAAVAWWRSRLAGGRPRPVGPSAAAAVEAGPERPRLAWPVLWIVASVSGFLTLSLEVLWTRMYAQVLQNSVYTFAAILTVFLVALALGSGVAHLLCRLDREPVLTLSALLTLAGLLVGLTPLHFYWLTSGLEALGGETGWAGYVATVFGGVAAVLLLPGMAIGSIFPFVLKLGEVRRASVGRTVGELASVNTLGAILGSLAAGFLILELIGLWAGIRWTAVAYLILAASVLPLGGRRTMAWRIPPLVGVVLFTTVFTYDGFAQALLDREQKEELVEAWEGSHGTVVVIRSDGNLRIKINNTYSLGTSDASLNQRLQAWLPLSLHPEPRAVFFLGMGTGITAGGALDFPVERVTVAELNPDVVSASRAHFGPYLNGLFEDPRVEVLAEDGRTFLLGTAHTYDVIVGDIFLTYRAGVGSLYTLEHFQTVRDHLAAGGVFVQWLPMFDLSRQEFGIIARTMLEVFPQVTAWRRGVSPRFPVLALAGRVDEAPLDLPLLERSLQSLAARGALPTDLWILNIPLAAYMGNLGALRSTFAEYPINTDDRTLLEYLAPRVERDKRSPQRTSVLAWLELADFSDRLLAEAPPSEDPHLALVDSRGMDQVLAGLAYYRFETYRRLGQVRQAELELARYRLLVGAD